MSVNNFAPKLWNKAVLVESEKVHVHGKVSKCEIDAPITKMGQSVHISGIGSITVGNYTGADIVMQAVRNTGMDFTIDYAKYIDFMIDDVDAMQANANLFAAASKEGSYALKDESDTGLNTLMAAGAGLSTTADGTVDVTAIISGVAELDLALKEARVPKESRWIIIPHWAATKLLLAGIYHAQDLKGNINGFITKVLGPDLYEADNIGATHPLGGSYRAVAFAEQILQTVPFQPEKRFGDALKSLYVYGYKVIWPNELVLGDWTEALDTVI
jgi:hypothetical protein